MTSRLLAAAAICVAAGLAVAQPPAKPAAPPKPLTKAAATAADALKAPPGFSVELVYSVPKDQQGSWVNLCVDPKGRLVASDQYGALYRITPTAPGDKSPAKVEKLDVAIGMAQGLCYAFDALYVVVNAGKGPGLYRVTDTNNDDMPDKVELLRPLTPGGGEHGPHAVMMHPDGKRLTLVCGNQTTLTDCATSLVPRNWGDDHLLPRMPDGNGFMKGVLAPGGYVVNVDPDGKNAELVSIGFRNQYDAAYNRAGDLFTYDADMEWDYNTPWYRPTRICHVTPGSDFGWRNGAGKYREYYLDNSAPSVNIGPGSPTGVCFGYGAKFPAKYQDAFFICDWSYGKLYAVHLTPDGAGYAGKAEEFVTGTPLPLTDVVISPVDGAMYFAVGGRKTQSGLYRVRYTGADSTEPAKAKVELTAGAKARRELEAFLKAGAEANGEQAGAQRTAQSKIDPALAEKAARAAWPHLASQDRTLRATARAVLEMMPVDAWSGVSWDDTPPAAKLAAYLAYTRSFPCPEHVNEADREKLARKGGIIRSTLLHQTRIGLINIDFKQLPAESRMDYLRTVAVAFHRLGKPDGNTSRETWIAKFDALLPQGNRQIDAELLNLLVFLDAPTAAEKGVALLKSAIIQEDQLDYALALRVLKTGWTQPLREDYFRWFLSAANFKGGNSLQGFIKLMKADAVATLTPEEKTALQPILDAKPAMVVLGVNPARKLVKNWTVDELVPQVETLLTPNSRSYARGRQLFAETSCFGCHRYSGEGGNTGPDLTGVAGRFGVRDLLESIILPSKEISDQYGSVEILTLDGKAVSGRIVNLSGDNVMVMTNGLDPNSIATVNRNNIEEMKPSKVSMMPAGLLDTLKPDEAADLVAYLLSQQNPKGRLFKEVK